MKAAAAPHPDEIESYTYNANERAEPPSAGFPKSPFDQNFDQKDLFGASEFQGFESRPIDLEKKTLDRLRIPGGQIDSLTFFRQSPFYPSNKKVLFEIRCEGDKGVSGRIVYDATGAVVDVVGP